LCCFCASLCPRWEGPTLPRTPRRTAEPTEAGELPQWAEKLGPVPDAPEWRERWIERAGTLAAYRALGEPEDRIELVGATDATLRRMVEQYERETEWAPPHVAGQLREVSESLSDLQREAVQKYIEAREAEDPARAEELQTTVEGYDALAASMEEDRKALEKVHEARQAWHEHTEDSRSQAQDAQRQLELRAPEPEAAPESLELQEDMQEPTLEPELEQPETGERERLREAHERAHVDGRGAAAGRPDRHQGNGDPGRSRADAADGRGGAGPPGRARGAAAGAADPGPHGRGEGVRGGDVATGFNGHSGTYGTFVQSDAGPTSTAGPAGARYL
jgi:hypothetical protein